MNLLPVQRASQLASVDPKTQWLVEGLWSEQAVGILGGEPKCCKSFLALDVAVSVASGVACLRQFLVRRSGPVLLFPAVANLKGTAGHVSGGLPVRSPCRHLAAVLDALVSAPSAPVPRTDTVHPVLN